MYQLELETIGTSFWKPGNHFSFLAGSGFHGGWLPRSWGRSGSVLCGPGESLWTPWFSAGHAPSQRGTDSGQTGLGGLCRCDDLEGIQGLRLGYLVGMVRGPWWHPWARRTLSRCFDLKNHFRSLCLNTMTASQQRTGMQFLRAHGESILAMFGVSVALFFSPSELGFTVTALYI